MSVISITAAPGFRAPRTRLRLTARGRRVLAILVALPIAGALAFGAIGAAIATAEPAAPIEYATITVLPGDTLWSLAALIAPEADPREVVDAIVRLNVLGGGDIYTGQQLAIPTIYLAP